MGNRQTQTKPEEDNLSKVTLGTEPNDPLNYSPGLEHHYPIMSALGYIGGQLDRDIYILHIISEPGLRVEPNILISIHVTSPG